MLNRRSLQVFGQHDFIRTLHAEHQHGDDERGEFGRILKAT